MRKYKASENIIEIKNSYFSSLFDYYQDFTNRTCEWIYFVKAKNRMLTHHITYDSSDVDNINVAYSKILCYMNLINDNYIKNEYEKMGIKNLFANLPEVVGPIKIFTVEEIDNSKIKIVNNTDFIVKSVYSLYDEFKNYTSKTVEGYEARLNWFSNVISIAQSIVFTVEYALKDYLYDEDLRSFLKNNINVEGYHG